MKEFNREPSVKEDYKSGLGVSFALHAFVLSFFILNTVFFPSEKIDFSQAVRVDIVALPDKKQDLPPKKADEPKKETPAPKKEPPKPEPVKEAAKPPPEPPKPAAKTPVKDPDAINLNKAKEKQQDALERIKAMSALEKIKADVNKDEEEARKKQAQEALEKAKQQAQQASQVKGNVLSAGSSLTGLDKLQHQSYLSDLDAHVKQYWTLPEWLSRQDYKAQARVFVDARGQIIGRRIIKSSGNPAYDEEVLATIDKAAPFPAPPEKFKDILNIDGIIIGFPE